ncbi:MAG: alanine-zipper protein [Nitrososphaerota archaeon]
MFWGKREEPKVNPLEAALLELESTKKRLEIMESIAERQLEYVRGELEKAKEELAKAHAQMHELQQKAEQAQQAAQQAQQTASQAQQAADQAQQAAEQAEQKAENAQQQDVLPPDFPKKPKGKKGFFGRIYSYLERIIEREYEEIEKEEEKYSGKKDKEKTDRAKKDEAKKGEGEGGGESGDEGAKKEEEQAGAEATVKIDTVKAEVEQAAVNIKVEGKSNEENKKGDGKDEDEDEDSDEEDGDEEDKKNKALVGFTKNLAKAAEGFSQAGSGLYKMSRALFGNLAVLPVALGKAIGRAIGDSISVGWKFMQEAPVIGGFMSTVKNFMGGLERTMNGLVRGISGIVGALKSLGSGVPGLIVDGLLKLGILVVNGVQDLGFYLGKVFFDIKNAILSLFSSSYEESLKKAKDEASRMPSRLSGGVDRRALISEVAVGRGGRGSVSNLIYGLPEKQRQMLRAKEAEGLGQFRGAMEYGEVEAEEDMWGGPELRYDAGKDSFEEVQAAARPQPTMMRTSRTFVTFTPPSRQYQYVEGRFAPPRPPSLPVEREEKRGKRAEGKAAGEAQGQAQTRRPISTEKRRVERERKREEAGKKAATISQAMTEAFQLLANNMIAISTMLASTAQLLANLPKGTTIPMPPGGGGGGGGTPP